jgi:hypothetical protein
MLAVACNTILGIGDPILPAEDAGPEAGERDARTDRGAPPVDSDLPPGDAGDDCAREGPNAACALFAQCGCEPGQTCDVKDNAGNTQCLSAGTRAMGEVCTATTSCARGLTCVFGTCHAFCPEADAACTTPRTDRCIQVNAGGGPIPGYKVCTVACDLDDPGSTCGGGAACFVDDKGMTDCQTGGQAAENEACPSGNDCAPGLVCINPGPICKRWCRVGTDTCPGGACRSFATKVVVRGVEFGACP